MSMYAYCLDSNGNKQYITHLTNGWNGNISHNPNDIFYDYSADKYYLRNLFVVDDYNRILGVDEIEANFLEMAKSPSATNLNFGYHRGPKPTSHSKTRNYGYHAHAGVVKSERKAIEICNEWGVKHRKRFSYDTWDGLEYNYHGNTYKKNHYGRHSTGWKDHKYRHQWEHNVVLQKDQAA